MLEDGIRIRGSRVPTVVADKQVLDRYTTAQLVPSDEEVENRVKGDFVATDRVYELRVRTLDVELNCFQDRNWLAR